MSRRRKRYTRSEKAFYILSILIVVSMVIGTIAIMMPTY